ncbi:hypothetical protein [Helicobacter bizzozeronii]|uniref:hypothetical protein n=1 Tax=Helicobacter bizzozeronii TaxID=56877 RepID=UPI000CEF52BC|nr:hypothetical protein [Helicobacter bizzozeronii]
MHSHIVFHMKIINKRFGNFAKFARHCGMFYTALLHRKRNPYYTRLNHATIFWQMHDDKVITINEAHVCKPN